MGARLALRYRATSRSRGSRSRVDRPTGRASTSRSRSSAAPPRCRRPRAPDRRDRTPPRPRARRDASPRAPARRGAGRAAVQARSSSRAISRRPLELDRREEERADAVVVVRHHRTRRVIRERPVAVLAAVGSDPEAGAHAGASDVDAPRALADEALHDAALGLDGPVAVRGRQMPEPRAFEKRIHEHARARLLEVVARAPALIENLPPDAGLVLHARDGLARLAQDREKRGPLRRVGEELDRGDERHVVTAEGSAPDTTR